MRGTAGLSMLDVAASGHDPSCMLMHDRFDADDLFVPASVHDDVVAYGLEVRSVYNSLKRLVGQLAGLMLMLEATKRREVFDLPSLAIAVERFDEVRQRMAKMRVPQRGERHFAQIRAASKLIEMGLATLQDRANAVRVGEASSGIDYLSRAYRHLQSASEDKFSMTMVDFKNSCCGCNAKFTENKVRGFYCE